MLTGLQLGRSTTTRQLPRLSGIPRVDWSHPLARGLKHFIVFLGGTSVDIAQEAFCPSTGTPTFGVTIAGIGVSCSGGLTNYVERKNSFNLTGSLTVDSNFRVDTATNGAPICYNCTIGTDQIYFWYDANNVFSLGTNLVAGYFDGASYHDVVGATALTTGQWYTGGFTLNTIANQGKIYLNGKQDGTTTTTSSAPGTLVGTSCFIGAAPNAQPNVTNNATMLYGRIWDRCLSPEEMRQVQTDPWCFCYTAEDDIFDLLSLPGIQFDASSNSTYKTASSTYSWSHTCTGSNRYLTVGISMLSVGGSSVSSITYNGVALSLIKAQASVSGAVRSELWGLTAPASGSNTIVVTLSTALDSIGGAVSFTGVHQTSPYEAANSATATNVGAADATVDVTTVADSDWCVDVVASDDTAITVGAGQTSRNNVTGTLGSGAMSTEGPKTPAGAVTMSWTNVAALATWSIVSVALRPTAASALSVTLTASKGTFLETGISSLFRINNVEAKGTFSETGVAALFRISEVVQKGTFSETGINSLFRINFVDSTGSFIEVGKNVLFDFDLPSNKGTFSETGINTLFRINEVVGKGTFILTGINAILKIGTFLTAATGTFTMSGKNILFQVDSIDSKGTFILSGKNANLTPNMISSKGTFSEVGKAVLFDIDMNMNKGTFVLTGRDATLTDTGAAPALNDDWIIRFRRRRER